MVEQGNPTNLPTGFSIRNRLSGTTVDALREELNMLLNELFSTRRFEEQVSGADRGVVDVAKPFWEFSLPDPQTIATATATKVLFEADVDSHSGFSAADNGYEIQVAGIYLVTLSIVWTGMAANANITTQISLNLPATPWAQDVNPLADPMAPTRQCTGMGYLTEGDMLFAVVSQNSGGNEDVEATAMTYFRGVKIA